MHPIVCTWTDDGTMVPLARFRQACDDQLVVGEVYRLEPVEVRSDRSHRHAFAWLHDAWLNLPEDIADQFPSPEHLRKRALIQAGYYDETIIDVGSKAGAVRVAQAWRAKDDFALVIVRGPLVVIRTAKSMSYRSMDGKTFQDAKTAIMEVVADMLGVTPKEMGTHAT